MKRQPCFLSLPMELLLHTLSYLDLQDLLRCSTVAKRLHKGINESSKLRYKMALEMYGMVSFGSPHNGPPISTRLRMLEEREHAWKILSLSNCYSLNLPATGSVYEFVGGFYGNGREDDRRVAASISFFQLPTLESSDPARSDIHKKWSHTMIDFSIIDFTMDPLQDLLVLVTTAPQESRYMYELHLRTLSTNEPHPKAPSATLGSVIKNRNNTAPTTGTSVRVQVSDDLVALLIKDVLDTDYAHLEIWNWRAGPQHSCEFLRHFGIDDFCFLSHNTFLLVLPTGRFEVNTFSDPRYHCSVPVKKATYAFPSLACGQVYRYISMSCNPAAGYVPPPSSESTNLPFAERPLFIPRQDDRIHACCLYVTTRFQAEDRIHSFVFFVNVRTFLQPESYAVKPGEDIAWELWGPQNTRWFPERRSTDWQHALYGYRTVDTVPLLGEEDSPHGWRRLRVRDYNPYAIARHMQDLEDARNNESGPVKGWVVATPTTAPAQGAFEQDVVSRLPYREIISKEAYDVTDVMMDDSRILLLKRGPDGQLKDIDVLIIG